MPTVRLFGHYLPLPLLLLAGVEFLLCALAVYTSADWNDMDTTLTTGQLLTRSVAFAAVMTLAMGSMGLYQTRTGEGAGGYLLRILLSFAVGSAILAILFYAFPSLFLSRRILIEGSLLAIAGILINRIIFVALVGSRALSRKVLVLGAGRKARALDEALGRKGHMGADIIGFVPIVDEPLEIEPGRLLSAEQPLIEVMQAHKCEEVVIAVTERRQRLPMSQLLKCRANGFRVFDDNTFFERETGKISLELLSTGWLLISEGFHRGDLARAGRRIFDIVAASLLLLLTLPVMLVTAIAIFVESGFSGPILYRQERVGENGGVFQVLKFRSMRPDAESDGVARWANRNDDRITRTGKWIRRMRIDELPQLVNVLRGEMAFVGPRPERPEFVSELARTIPYYDERHSIKPGLTGWAQLRYPYGASAQDAAEKLQFDLYYIKNHSLFLDLLILLQTVEVVIFGRGAR